jgi:hypothetical protein
MCHKTGHYAYACPEKKKNQGDKPNSFQKGHVNHANMEEVLDEPDAVIGTFLLNTFSALALFDIGASHSFISRVFMDRSKIPTKSIGNPLK